MSNESTLSREELDNRIAILRDNIRQLTEQAAAFSGAADEARNADRIAAQEAELDRLTKQREAMGIERSADDIARCFMLSRSRTVTASSVSVSKSTVTQYGVPISSWRR